VFKLPDSSVWNPWSLGVNGTAQDWLRQGLRLLESFQQRPPVLPFVPADLGMTYTVHPWITMQFLIFQICFLVYYEMRVVFGVSQTQHYVTHDI
jgi:hypothetical protein